MTREEAGAKRFDAARERRHEEQKNKPREPINLPKRPCSRCGGTLYKTEHFHEGRGGGKWQGVPYPLPFSGWVTGVHFWCVKCSGPGHQFGFSHEHKREPDEVPVPEDYCENQEPKAQ